MPSAWLRLLTSSTNVGPSALSMMTTGPSPEVPLLPGTCSRGDACRVIVDGACVAKGARVQQLRAWGKMRQGARAWPKRGASMQGKCKCTRMRLQACACPPVILYNSNGASDDQEGETCVKLRDSSACCAHPTHQLSTRLRAPDQSKQETQCTASPDLHRCTPGWDFKKMLAGPELGLKFYHNVKIIT